jgi:tagaturonate reductase
VLRVLDDWDAPIAARRRIGEDSVWVNSLVDRIVSQPLEPLGAVAEPYALWAIEDRAGLEPPCSHPDVKLTNDLKRYERLKLLSSTWAIPGSPNCGTGVMVRRRSPYARR